MMYFYLFLILALIYFIYFRFTIETFITENHDNNNYDRYLIDGKPTSDSGYLIGSARYLIDDKHGNSFIDTSKLSQKKQLVFLDKINNIMKNSRENDNTIDLKNSYNELKKNADDKFKKDSCVSISSELCEYTNPYFYLPETINTPPAYLLKSFKDITLPKDVDLNCFNTMFNCCKNSKIL